MFPTVILFLQPTDHFRRGSYRHDSHLYRRRSDWHMRFRAPWINHRMQECSLLLIWCKREIWEHWISPVIALHASRRVDNPIFEWSEFYVGYFTPCSSRIQQRNDQILFQENIPKYHAPKPSKFPNIWDAQHAINAHMQRPFPKTEKHSAIGYT
jgi:hypothetical protein